MGAVESADEHVGPSGPVPQAFLCPISGGIMEDPVSTSDGHIYNRASIESWFRARNQTSPQTGEDLKSLNLTSCEALQRAIAEYMVCRPDLEHREASDFALREAAALLERRSRLRGQEQESRRSSFEQLRALSKRLAKAAQSFPDTHLRAETREVAELLEVMIIAQVGKLEAPGETPHVRNREIESPRGRESRFDANLDPDLPMMAPRKAFDGGLSLAGNKFAIFGVVGGSKPTLDLNDDRCIRTLAGHKHVVQCVVALGSGQVATASDDKTVRTWDTATGHWLSTLAGHERSVCGLAVVGEGQLVSCSFDSSLKVWSLPGGGAATATLRGHKSSVQCVTPLGAGGLVASGSADRGVKIWDLSAGSCVGTITGHEKKIRSLSAINEWLLASGSWDSTVRIWDVEGGRCSATLMGHTRRVWSVAALGEDRLASGASDNEVRIWDVSTGKCVTTLKGHTKDVTCVVQLDARRIVTASLDQTVRVWDVVNAVEAMPMLRGHRAGVLSACVLSDKQLASGSADATAKIWDTRV